MIIIPDHAIHRMELRIKTPEMEMSEEEKLVLEHKEKFPNANQVEYSVWADAYFCLKQRVFITPKCKQEFNYGSKGQTPTCEYCDERNIIILKEFEIGEITIDLEE